MSPRLAHLQAYPFDKLRDLLAGVTPNPALGPIDLSIGEPRHPTPALVKDALAGALDGLSGYPRAAGLAELREAIAVQRDYNVLVLPGSFLTREAHGENPGKNHVRLALVAPLDECVEAVGRLMQFTRAL